jgi:hypothetical protein
VAGIRRCWPVCLPWITCAILLLPSLYWVFYDSSVWPWDPAWYGQASVDLWYTLIHEPLHWLKEMRRAFEIKAPGVAWLGQFFVPVGQCLRSIEAGLLLSVLVTQLGTLVLSYKTAERLFPEQRLLPFLNVMLVASSPLFIGLSHQYFAEPLQLFSVSYFYWLAVASRNMGRGRLAGHLLSATAVAMLAKVTSPMYCLLPGLIALWNWVRSYPEGAKEDTGCSSARVPLVAGIALFAAALAWYGEHLRLVFHFAEEASSGNLASQYGVRDTFLNQLQFWLTSAQQSFWVPPVLVVLGLALTAIVAVKSVRLFGERPPDSWNWRATLATAAGFQVVAVLLLFSLNVNRTTRYLLPLLPSLALVVCCVSSVKQSWPALALCVLLLAQWTYVQSQALGLGPPDLEAWTVSGNRREMIRRGISPLVRRPRPEKLRKTELQELVQHTAGRGVRDRYNLCGIDLPWLNHNSLSFYAAKNRLKTGRRCYYTSLGYAEENPTNAWNRLNSLKIAYFISLDAKAHPKRPGLLNRVSLPVLERIQSDPRFVREPFDTRLDLVVFRNTEEAGR